MRVVLDTHVLVSAFFFPGGAPEAVYRLALEGQIELVTSPTLLAEFGRVLTEKLGRDDQALREAVAQVSSVGMLVRPSGQLAVISDDPDDDRALEAASEGRAEAIVSGDRHLLRLGQWEGVRIVNPPVSWTSSNSHRLSLEAPPDHRRPCPRPPGGRSQLGRSSARDCGGYRDRLCYDVQRGLAAMDYSQVTRWVVG
ncbi:MAG: putative toxin-antitoxin system toxin component, PIN family [Actinomycetota bacterium]